MQELSYDSFSKRIVTATAGRRIPLSGTIELTNRCPLNCSHCYNNLPMNDVAARKRELTTNEYKDVLDQLADLGALWVCFSGGEIFARRDFFEIYDYAKAKGFLVTLFTNGILIDERVADRLAENRPFSIEITLYGKTPETYEELTRIPGSWAKCIRGIELLRERNLPLKLKTVAVSVNRHEVFEMKAFAEELGIDFKFDPMMNPRIDCSSSPLAVRLTPLEAVDLDLRDPARVEAWHALAKTSVARPLPVAGENVQVYDCGGGVNSWAIDPYGNLTICVLSHVDNFNLREYTVAEAWEHLGNVRRKPTTRPTKCTQCAMRSLCGMCAAQGELENQDAESPVDFLCHTAHLRVSVLGHEFPLHGECEYCVGGSAHDVIVRETEQALSAGSRPLIESSISPAASCGSGGCSSCT
ncbi:MAG TPA: radical SAM protein [Thermoanaerobaculia bacterium]|jgi:radical SAM protein with 4Fe4S-binding SPASM domain